MTKNKLHVIADKITRIENDTRWEQIFSESLKQSKKASFRIGFVNAHAVNLAYRNDAFLNDLLSCDLVLRDGIGMKIFYRLQKINPGLNMNGTDLIPKILEHIKGQSLALFGTSTPYLENAAALLKDQGHQIVLTENGFHTPSHYADLLKTTPADCIILGMGMPKQEAVAAYLAKHIHSPCLILCGGAILDFLGGKVTRAPDIFRKFGFEWLYRLILEPKRLFHRYVIGNAVFLVRAVLFCLHTQFAQKHDLQRPPR